MTKISKTLLLAFLGLIYGVIKVLLPDFPLDEGTFVVIVLYVLALIGVEVVEVRFRAFFAKRGLLK